MSLIEATGIGVDIGGRQILRDIDFTIDRGEIVMVIGPNGSGKSTFIRVLVGAIPPSHGQVTQAPRLVVGYVPQRLALDAAMPLTVARFLNLPNHRRPADVAEMLEHVGVGGLQQRQMSALSGGQFQRVLLARALLSRPDILILDEPTQSLDQPGTAAFYRLIEMVRRELGCAVLMVSHDLHVVMSASDRVLCINGHICCEGTPTVVSAAPEYRALFGTGTQGAFALYPHQHNHHHPESEGSAADA